METDPHTLAEFWPLQVAFCCNLKNTLYVNKGAKTLISSLWIFFPDKNSTLHVIHACNSLVGYRGQDPMNPENRGYYPRNRLAEPHKENRDTVQNREELLTVEQLLPTPLQLVSNCSRNFITFRQNVPSQHTCIAHGPLVDHHWPASVVFCLFVID